MVMDGLRFLDTVRRRQYGAPGLRGRLTPIRFHDTALFKAVRSLSALLTFSRIERRARPRGARGLRWRNAKTARRKIGSCERGSRSSRARWKLDASRREPDA